MNLAATLHRYIYILRRLNTPYSYPSKKRIVDELTDKGFQSSPRTFERDIQSLKQEYGVQISYDKTHKGYCWAFIQDEDITHFETFLELLERKERLDFLSNSPGNWLDTSRYLLLEKNHAFKGIDHLPQLWDALHAKRVITFLYQSYSQTIAQTRSVEPNLIVEERNRWYLVGRDQDKNDMRFFGLDRIEQLALTNKIFEQSVQEDYRKRKQQAIGMTCLDEPAQRVVLRVDAKEIAYMLSLPWHDSQQVVEETETYTDIALTVVLNYELEREILGKGEAIEVLEPLSLRQTIAQRIKQAIQKYEEQ